MSSIKWCVQGTHELDNRLFSQDEREWLQAYGTAVEELAQGVRVPKTAAQAAFVAVVRGEAAPASSAEKLWVRFSLFRRCTDLAGKVAKHDGVLEAVSRVRRSALFKLLGTELLEASDHPGLLRVCADHYLFDEPTDPAKGLTLALQAAEMGDGEAAYIVGLIYEQGIGCPPDVEKSLTYYTLAAERGVERAKTKLPVKVPDSPPWRERYVWTGVSKYPGGVDGDWGSSDDFDSAKWESIMGGPEDGYFGQ